MEKSQQLSASPGGFSDKDISMVKALVIVSLTAIFAAISGYFIVNPSLIFGTIAFVLFFTLFTLQVILIKSWNKISAAIVIQSLALALPVLISLNFALPGYLITAWLVFLFLFLTAESSGKQRIKNSLHLPFWTISRIVLAKAITAVLVFMALVYLFIPAPVGSGLSAAVDKINNSTVVPIVRLFIPNFSAESNVNDLFLAVAEGVINQQDSSDNLSPAEKAALTQIAADDLKSSAQESVGPIDFGLNLLQAFNKLIVEFVGKLGFFDKLYIYGITALVAWFIFRGAAALLYLPVAVFIFLVYETLIVTGFISVEYESRSREMLLLK